MKCIDRGRASALLAAAALFGAANAWAGIGFDRDVSTLTITHDADISSPNIAPFVRSIGIVPPSRLIYPVNPFQMDNHQFVVGDSSSLAAGSLGHVTNATTGSFILAPGTGVSQVDPATPTKPNGEFGGASSLKFNFDLRWDITAGGFGPLANGYASFVVGGVVGEGGSATVKVNLQWRNQSGTVLRDAYAPPDRTYTAGAFTDTFTTSRILGSGALPAGSKLRLLGSVEFLASNQGGPTAISPLRAEVGGNPPTAHFKISQGGDYFNGDNWESFDIEEDGLRGIANAAGERAVFFNTEKTAGPRVVSLGSRVTLGSLEIGGSGPYIFANGDSGRIEFATVSGANAVLNSSGTGIGHAIQVPISLSRNLELITDRQAGVAFADEITGSHAIDKYGPGEAILSAGSAEFGGAVTIFEGTLAGNAPLSLGLGVVTVDGGTLRYGAPRASGQPVQVANGMLDLLVAAGATDRFSIGSRGAIGGTPAAVSALVVGQTLLLQPNAMIVHSDPGNTQSGNPQNLGNEALYLFGITGAMPLGNLVVGSQSGTPWKGVGGIGDQTTFGSRDSVLTVAGDATISALPGGTMTINSAIVGTSNIQKVGDGTIKLAGTNPYTGNVSVAEGALLVNGSVGGNVLVGSAGTVGGSGIIIGMLQASQEGGQIEPGDGDVGTLKVGDLQLNNSTALNFDLNRPGDSDQIQVAGDLLLDGVLFLNTVEDLVPGKYAIMQYGRAVEDRGLEIGFAPEGFNFEIVVEPNEIIIGLLSATSSGGTVYLVVVPEPATLTMIAVGGLGLLRRRRKR